jgi:hypothetical protein
MFKVTFISRSCMLRGVHSVFAPRNQEPELNGEKETCLTSFLASFGRSLNLAIYL